MSKIIVYIGLALLMLVQFSNAGDISRIGTTSGSELLIPVGAKSIALGGAVVSSAVGAEALYYNPGGLAKSNKSEILFSNMSYIADIDVNYIAASFYGNEIGSFGLSIKSLSFGDIEETTEDFPDGTGNSYSPSIVTLGFTYGRMLIDRISAGVTLKYVYEGIMQTSASTMAADLGIQYTFDRNLKLGVVMKNVGGKLQFDGRNLENTSQIPGANPDADNGYFRGVTLASDIPSTFSFGVTYMFDVNEENRVNMNGSFINQNDASDQFFGGIEYDYNDFVFLRGGYAYDANDSNNQLFGASFGGGIKYQVGEFDFKVDYAYRQLLDYFDANHIFTITLGL
jgi:type IX secretion system protein PorV